MVTPLHVSLALASIVYLTLLVIRPAKVPVAPAYVTVGTTLVSGLLLMLAEPSTIPHVCVSGTVYMVVSCCAILFARRQKAKYFTAS